MRNEIKLLCYKCCQYNLTCIKPERILSAHLHINAGVLSHPFLFCSAHLSFLVLCFTIVFSFFLILSSWSDFKTRQYEPLTDELLCARLLWSGYWLHWLRACVGVGTCSLFLCTQQEREQRPFEPNTFEWDQIHIRS